MFACNTFFPYRLGKQKANVVFLKNINQKFDLCFYEILDEEFLKPDEDS